MKESHYKAIIVIVSSSLFGLVTLFGFTTVVSFQQQSLRSSNKGQRLIYDEENLVKARAFDPWPVDRPLPCPSQWQIQSSEPKWRGFLFLRPFKCASSTTQSVNFRIARNEAKRQGKASPFCSVSAGHGPLPYPASDTFGDRQRDASVLWSIIRDPTARAISHFFYVGVRKGWYKPNGEDLREDLFDDEFPNRPNNYYIQALSLDHFHHGDDPIDFANQILQDYDFIGVTERLDESLVAFKMLLDIPMADILHLDSKKSGEYKLSTDPPGCSLVPKAYVTPDMQEVLDSPEWHESIKHDVLLHKAANRSLSSKPSLRIYSYSIDL
jgi:hypothetical protein